MLQAVVLPFGVLNLTLIHEVIVYILCSCICVFHLGKHGHISTPPPTPTFDSLISMLILAGGLVICVLSTCHLNHLSCGLLISKLFQFCFVLSPRLSWEIQIYLLWMRQVCNILPLTSIHSTNICQTTTSDLCARAEPS